MSGTVVPGDPFGVHRPDKNDQNPSAQAVNQFHRNADTDSSVTAAHHTLGPRRGQATPGDHTHNGKLSRKLGDGEGLVLTGAKGGNVALANLIIMLAEWFDFVDNTT